MHYTSKLKPGEYSVQQLFLTFRTIFVHIMFSPCSAKGRASDKDLPVQEAWAKCFLVHLLEFEILQTTWKNKTNSIKILDLLMKNWKIRVWYHLLHFFHVICKILNFNMWAAKHLAQASCTELTLRRIQMLIFCRSQFNQN